MTALCIIKPENVSPSCRHIIVSMLWGDEFLFSTFMPACFDFWGQKTGGGGEGSPCYGPAMTKERNLTYVVSAIGEGERER